MIAHYDYKFRKASLLDIPFIFNLIQIGSLNGAFNEFLMTSKGYIFTLRELFLDVLRPLRIKLRTDDIKLLIFTLNNEDIGFIRIKSQFAGEHTQEISLCSITPEHRNQKHGTQMIRMYIENLPIGTEVIAYCSIYSEVMQHTLKKLKFQKEEKNLPDTDDCYRFTKNPDAVQMNSDVTPVKSTLSSAQI